MACPVYDPRHPSLTLRRRRAKLENSGRVSLIRPFFHPRCRYDVTLAAQSTSSTGPSPTAELAPCDGCPHARLCAKDGFECRAYRYWVTMHGWTLEQRTRATSRRRTRSCAKATRPAPASPVTVSKRETAAPIALKPIDIDKLVAVILRQRDARIMAIVRNVRRSVRERCET